MNPNLNFRNSAVKRKTFIAIACVLTAAAVQAQDSSSMTFPNGPVKIVVPYPPGGPFDILARMIQPKLQAALGTTVIVENKAGAGGNIGAEAVARAKPDGHTLLMMGSAHSISATLYAKLPYDPAKDLVPVAPVAEAAFVLLASNKVPADTPKDLFKLAKERSGKVTYASGGAGSVGHLAAVRMNLMSGTEMIHVPYKGSGPALTDLIGGQVDLFFNTIVASVPQIKAGKVKPLAVTASARSPLLPEVPTLAESGLKGYVATSWFGLAAPSGTPGAIVRRLHEEVTNALKQPEMAEEMKKRGLDPLLMDAAEFGAFVRKDISAWAREVKQSGATVD